MIVKTTMITDGPTMLDMKLAVDELVKTARDTVPVGTHAHDQGVPFQSFKPRTGGTLRALIGSKANWRYKISGVGMYAAVTLQHFGAAALEFGADIGQVVKKFMAWNQPGVGVIRSSARRAYRIEPKPFSGTILDRFLQRTRLRGAVEISWKRGSRKVVG